MPVGGRRSPGLATAPARALFLRLLLSRAMAAVDSVLTVNDRVFNFRDNHSTVRGGFLRKNVRPSFKIGKVRVSKYTVQLVKDLSST